MGSSQKKGVPQAGPVAREIALGQGMTRNHEASSGREAWENESTEKPEGAWPLGKGNRWEWGGHRKGQKHCVKKASREKTKGPSIEGPTYLGGETEATSTRRARAGKRWGRSEVEMVKKTKGREVQIRRGIKHPTVEKGQWENE